ncbi:hypothetical protein LTR17_002329 [Elasticomyces elasticus]|nr:hypothetical protein LTR17_002329 [Elasticomyces elasticus]
MANAAEQTMAVLRNGGVVAVCQQATILELISNLFLPLHLHLYNNHKQTIILTMATSPLLSISAELRNRIYELVLSQEEPIIVRGEYEDLDSQYPNVSVLSFDRTAAHLTALTMTCKTIYGETRSLPYFLNTFVFENNDIAFNPGWRETKSTARLFLQQIGPENRAALRSIRFDFPKIYAAINLPRDPFLDLAQIAKEQPQITNFQCTATIFFVYKQEAWNYVEQKQEVEIDVRKLLKSFKDLAIGFLERSKALEKEGSAGEKNWLLAWRLSRTSTDMDRLRTGWESKGGIEGCIEHWLALNDE